ncbi:MAG TPA: glycosyltransferase, partial [Terriglobia bacterium]|nr:glycosyltransferase [Terriglobia bacterium]
MNATSFASSPKSQTPGSAGPMRIAFFTETFLPRVDGTVTRLCNTVRCLRGLGHEVLVIAPDGGIAEFEGARIHGVPGFPFPLYPELKLAFPWPSVGRALAAFQPDLIHTLHPVLLGIAAFRYSSAHRLPLIISYHSQVPKWLHYYGAG